MSWPVFESFSNSFVNRRPISGSNVVEPITTTGKPCENETISAIEYFCDFFKKTVPGCVVLQVLVCKVPNNKPTRKQSYEREIR